jgi:hypothetical protein
MPVKIARSTPRPSFGLRELLVASHISRLASRDAAKSLLSTLVSESSGECRIIPACGDIDSCAHAPCQSKTPISHWTAGGFCDGCLGGWRGQHESGSPSFSISLHSPDNALSFGAACAIQI